MCVQTFPPSSARRVVGFSEYSMTDLQPTSICHFRASLERLGVG